MSPYFTKPRDCDLQNRLQSVAQSIKSKATVIDGGRKTKVGVAPVSGGGFSSGNDGDDDHGYVTAHEG